MTPTTKPTVLAEVTGTLLCIDIDEVQVDDLLFIGGAEPVRRVLTRPSGAVHERDSDGTHQIYRRWRGRALHRTPGPPERDDGFWYQTATGRPCLVLRP